MVSGEVSSKASLPPAEVAAIREKPAVQDSTRSPPMPKQGDLLSDTAANKPIAANEDNSGSKPGEDDVSGQRSEEHTSELQSLMRISYAVFCLTKKNKTYKRYQ